MTLALFDIDGTLMRSGGAGREAMVMAATEVFGRPDAFEGVSFAGSLDPSILRDALARIGQQPDPALALAFRRAYYRALRATMSRALDQDRAALCPGVPAAVEACRVRGSLGLLTGNWRRGARIKLGALDFWAPFAGEVGAFGDDGTVRGALPPVAWRRARRRGLKARRVLVIGDTPADVACARAGHVALAEHGVEVLAVAVGTGFSTREALVASAPDLLVDDLAVGLTRLLELMDG